MNDARLQSSDWAACRACKVRAQIHRTALDNINQVLSDLKAGKIDGRAVLLM
jgi:D-arabinose 1-dehydrogenase-like Zn-dependent alcohol dehydrogenase